MRKLRDIFGCQDHNGWFTHDKDGIDYFKCWTCGGTIKQTKKESDNKFKAHLYKMRERENQLVVELGLKIGSRYSGAGRYGSAVGKLTGLECASDGDFANILCDDGRNVQDLNVRSLILIKL